MLISFAVSNYKSFKNEQIFSMQKDTSIDGEKDSFIYDEGEPGLSYVAAIYGANAAGKSNFLQAFADLYNFTIIGNKPDSVSRFVSNDNAAVNYDVVFLSANKTKYNYSLEILPSGVKYERLAVYTSAQPTIIFEWDALTNKPELNKKFFTKEEMTAVSYNASTNATTILHQLSKIEDQRVKDAYEFFATNIVSHSDMDLGKKGDGAKISAVIQREPAIHSMLNALLPAADLGIQAIDLVEKDSGSNTKQQEILAKAMIEYAKASDLKPTDEAIERLKHNLAQKTLKAVFRHKIGNSFVNFGIDQESDGTIAASSIFMDLLPVLLKGLVYLVDELDRSLHPTIVAQIIDIFSHKETNPNGAQLIFTTHDVSLLDSSAYGKDLLDRDEVWFVEKNRDGESEIYPLTSIKYTTTKNTNAYRKYIEGRYGATPRVSISTAVASFWGDQNA